MEHTRLSKQELWQAVLGEVRDSLSAANFQTWLKGTSILTYEDSHVVIGVPNIFTRSWMQGKFKEPLAEALKKIGGVTKIDYEIASPKKQAEMARDNTVTISTDEAGKKGKAKAKTQSVDNKQELPRHHALNPKYTFDTFVVGSSNELAYAASQAVAKSPGHKYNPLFLYGGVGLGKTHLMQAIGNQVLHDDPSKRIEYVTSEEFTNSFLDSIRNKRTSDFARRFRNVDVLIIDDMQFLGGKEKTQEEFFHTFNTLHQTNKQIIMSSDRRPAAIPHLDDRLKSRFESGMTADVQSPDLETRAAILMKKAANQNFILPASVATYMAQQIKKNIRELEGALTTVIGQCELKGLEPTIPVVSAILGTIDTKKPKRSGISAKTVIERVAGYYDLRSDDITGVRRSREIMVPRQVAMYIMRHELNLSLPKIGSACGGRDHTTAIHGISKIEHAIELDEALREEVQAVTARVLA